MPPSPRSHGRSNASSWRSGVFLASLALLAIISYAGLPSRLLGDAYEPKFHATGEMSLNGESKESEISIQGDKLIHTSFSRKDLSYPISNPAAADDAPVQTQAGGDRSSTALEKYKSTVQPPVSILAVISRYNEDISWFTDPNTGIMNNSTGTPKFILPIEIYQASDIDSEGLPTFPGLLPLAPDNITALNLSIDELHTMNYSAYGENEILPTWPEWAWKYVVEKNATKTENKPGSLEEAEYLARKRLGLPQDGKGPSDYEGWRDYENLFDEEYMERKREKGMLGKNGEEEENAFLSSLTKEESYSLLDALDSSDSITAASRFKNSQEEDEEEDQEKAENNNKKKKLERLKEIFLKFKAENRSQIVTIPDISPIIPLKIMPNRGAESMAYLSAIIDHYENLPDLMVFMHGHRLAWHTPLLGQDWILRRLATHPPADLNLSSTNGYHALGCLERWGNDISQLFPTNIDANWRSNNGPRWHEALSARFAQAWREHLGEAYNMPLPEYVRVPTAATFIASKNAIQRRPKEFYVGVRDWLMKTHIENKWLGIVMEFQLGIMFANKTHFSISQEQCLCELYSICTLPAEL